jgi:hypothetical protein
MPLDSDPFVTVKYAEDYAMREMGHTVYGYLNKKRGTLVHGYHEAFHILSDRSHPDNQGRLLQFADQPDNEFHDLDWECITDGPTWKELVEEHDPGTGFVNAPGSAPEVSKVEEPSILDDIDAEIEAAMPVASTVVTEESAPKARRNRGG